MKQHWRKIMIVAGVAILSLFLAVLLRPREPTYQGKPLSYWAEQLWTPGAAEQDQARTALRAIGPKAVPLLLGQIRRQNSLSLRLYRDTWPRLPRTFRRVFPRPKPLDEDLARRIGLAVGQIGAAAVPHLIPALEDRHDGVRLAAVVAMERIAPKSDTAVTAVARLLKDPSGLLRFSAVNALGRMRPNSVRAVPGLIGALRDGDMGPKPGSQVLVRANAARVLGRIGPRAKAAVPELARLVRATDQLDPRIIYTPSDSYTVLQAAVALWRIDHNTNGLPFLIATVWKVARGNAFSSFGSPNVPCFLALETLGQMGNSAQAAVPAILAIVRTGGRLNSSMQTEILRAAQEALARIDPQATEPTAAQLIADLRMPNRDVQVPALEIIRQLGPKAGEALPVIIPLLNHPDAQVRIGSLVAVEGLGTIRTQAIPALVAALQDPNRIAEAKSRTGFLKQRVGRNYLRLISQGLVQVGDAPIPLEYLKLLEVLCEMGPAAKPSVPVLLRCLTNLPPDMSEPILQTMRKIDPDSAATLDSPSK